jgi:hypothetical protein
MGGIKLFSNKLNKQNRKYPAAIISILLASCALVVVTDCSNVELKDFVELLTEFSKTGGVIYVRPAGNDANIGTIDKPKATIQSAIAFIESIGETGEVRVAEGVYRVNYREGVYINMREGVSLYGGYSSDFRKRDSDMYESVIVDESGSGGGGDDHNRAVYAPPGIRRTTVLDGFTIQGGGGDRSIAVMVDGSSPTITNNDIEGGWADIAVGIRLENSSAHVKSNDIYGGDTLNKSRAITTTSCPLSLLIEDNNIEGGDGLFNSIGIRSKEGSEPTIRGNWIDGGYGFESRGIHNIDSSPTIQGNSIYGGGGSPSTGIENLRSYPLILENYINGGDGGFTYGIICQDDSYPQIMANEIHGGTPSDIFGGSTGIFIDNETLLSDEIKIWNNVINGGDVQQATSAGIKIVDFFNVVIQNNTIDGGTAALGASYGIYLSSLIVPSQLIIENNIIFATGGAASIRFCVFEADAFSDPWNVFNNNFWNKPNVSDTILYFDEGAVQINPIDFGTTPVTTGFSTDFLPNWANLQDNPEFIDVDDLRLTPSGSLNGLVRTWGLDLSPDIITDKDGVIRTGNGSTGWSMGAYEQDE